jgi:hypothetical protein
MAIGGGIYYCIPPMIIPDWPICEQCLHYLQMAIVGGIYYCVVSMLIPDWPTREQFSHDL